MNAKDLKDIFAAGRPLVEQSLDIADHLAALRDAATEKGIDWSQVKALLKAQVLDERDGTHRVGKIIEKADYAQAYAEMLGLGASDTKMNENNFSADAIERAAADPKVRAAVKKLGTPVPLTEDEKAKGQTVAFVGKDGTRMSLGIPAPTDAELEIPDYLDRRASARA